MSYKKTALVFVVSLIIAAEFFLFIDVTGDYREIAIKAFAFACIIALLRNPALSWYKRNFIKHYKYNVTRTIKQKQYRLFADISNSGDPRLVQVNIRDADKTYELHVIAPGLLKDDFKIDVEGSLLKVSYNEKSKSNAKMDNWLRREYILRSFMRSFTIDNVIDTGSISAIYKDGILQIFLPKKENIDTINKNIEIR